MIFNRNTRLKVPYFPILPGFLYQHFTCACTLACGGRKDRFAAMTHITLNRPKRGRNPVEDNLNDQERKMRRRIILSTEAGGSETGTNNNVFEVLQSLAASQRGVSISGLPPRYSAAKAMKFGRRYGAVTMGIETEQGSFVLA